MRCRDGFDVRPSASTARTAVDYTHTPRPSKAVDVDVGQEAYKTPQQQEIDVSYRARGDHVRSFEQSALHASSEEDVGPSSKAPDCIRWKHARRCVVDAADKKIRRLSSGRTWCIAALHANVSASRRVLVLVDAQTSNMPCVGSFCKMGL